MESMKVAPVLPLRGRLQHLCAESAGGGAGAGLGERMAGSAATATGERRQECGRTPERAAVSGLPDYRSGHGATEHRAEERCAGKATIRRITRRNRGVSLGRV